MVLSQSLSIELDPRPPDERASLMILFFLLSPMYSSEHMINPKNTDEYLKHTDIYK
jgi:hypothetical protein